MTGGQAWREPCHASHRVSTASRRCSSWLRGMFPLNSYKLETLQGTPLEGLFNARRLRGFVPREGTELAAQQTKFEEELASQELGTVEVDRPEVEELGGKEKEGIVDENLEDVELGMESAEWEIQGEGDGRAGFFYDDEEEEVQEDEDMGIGARVAARMQGRLQNGGGQME